MKYKNIKSAIFKSRPNRFIAICEVDGKAEVCHVKNTGRCRELLVPGCRVYLEKSDNPDRKTKYDLVAVYKGEELFNIDSQAPNKVFGEWLKKGNLFESITLIKPECRYKNSRFDFYVEHKGGKTFVEVKGVTLEEDGVLLFPDAPTARGVKHIYELCEAKTEGYGAYIVFIVQTEKAEYFTPNTKTHREFAEALRCAKGQGVEVICLNCHIEPDALEIKDFVTVKL